MRKPAICLHCNKDFPDCHCAFKAPKKWGFKTELYSQVVGRTVGEMLDELNQHFSHRDRTCAFKIVVYSDVMPSCVAESEETRS